MTVGRLRSIVVRSALPALALLATAWGALAADQLVDVYIDGKVQQFTPQARVRGRTTYVPLRAAAQALGAKVDWKAKSQTAVVCQSSRCVPIRKDQGIVINGALLIPLRLMAEALSCEVQWDAAKKAVRVTGANCAPSG